MKKMSEYSECANLKMIRAVVICKWTGEYLVDLILDECLNPVLLSGFVSALSMFGNASLGEIEDISINGLDVDMIIVTKGDLIMVVVMDKSFLKNSMREEAVNLLEAFHTLYFDDIQHNSWNVDVFKEFKNVIMSHMHQVGKRTSISASDIIIEM